MPTAGNYYDDAGAMSPETQSMPEDKSGGDDKSKGDGETALANKSAFPGDCKPGDKYEVEVVGVHGEELEFKVTGGHEGYEDAGEQDMQPEAEPTGQMRSMLED